MKKALFLFLVLFSALNSADAQWHERSCGVTDLESISAEEFDCLWIKATNTARIGAITTGVGSSLCVAGTLVVLATQHGDAAFTGLAIVTIGVLIDWVGVPVWIIGARRKSELSLSPHNNTLNPGALNIAPTINRNQFNNSYYFGLRASYSF